MLKVSRRKLLVAGMAAGIALPTKAQFLSNSGGSNVATTPSPLDIFGSDLVAWHDFSDATKVHTTGGVVDTVDDKSGNGYTSTGLTTTRPSYSATSFQANSPGAVFDGVNDVMNASIALGGTAMTAFVFAQQDRVPGTFQQLVSYHAAGDAGEFSSAASMISYTAAGPYPSVYRGGQKSTATDLNFTNGGVYRRYCMTFDGVNNVLYFDKIAYPAVASTGSFGATGIWRFRARADGSEASKGALSEVILVKRAATADERSKVDNWFMRHWPRIIVFEGDSLQLSVPEGVSPAVGALYPANSNPAAFVIDKGQGGTAFNTDATSIYQRAAAWVDPQLPPAKHGRQWVLFIGSTNNLNFNSGGDLDTDATVVTNLYGTYAGLRKAAGYDKVVWSTVLSRTDAQASDVFRNKINAILMTPGWAAAHNIDAVVDYASIPQLGEDAAPTTYPTLFVDGVHPSAAGNVLREAKFRTVMNALPL